MRGEIRKKQKEGREKGEGVNAESEEMEKGRRSTNKGVMNRCEPFHWRAIASHAVLVSAV